MAFLAASFWIYKDYRSACGDVGYEKQYWKNGKKWKKLLTNKKNDGIINLAVEETP